MACQPLTCQPLQSSSITAAWTGGSTAQGHSSPRPTRDMACVPSTGLKTKGCSRTAKNTPRSHTRLPPTHTCFPHMHASHTRIPEQSSVPAFVSPCNHLHSSNTLLLHSHTKSCLPHLTTHCSNCSTYIYTDSYSYTAETDAGTPQVSCSRRTHTSPAPPTPPLHAAPHLPPTAPSQSSPSPPPPAPPPPPAQPTPPPAPSRRGSWSPRTAHGHRRGTVRACVQWRTRTTSAASSQRWRRNRTAQRGSASCRQARSRCCPPGVSGQHASERREYLPAVHSGHGGQVGPFLPLLAHVAVATSLVRCGVHPCPHADLAR